MLSSSPSRTVTLLPKPRDTGMSPSIFTEKGKRRSLPPTARSKNASVVAAIMPVRGRASSLRETVVVL